MPDWHDPGVPALPLEDPHAAEDSGGVVPVVRKPDARQSGFLNQRVKQRQDIGRAEEPMQWLSTPCHAEANSFNKIIVI